MPIPCPELPEDDFTCPVQSGPLDKLPPGPSGFSGTIQDPCPGEIWARLVTNYSDANYDWDEVQGAGGGVWLTTGRIGRYCAVFPEEFPAMEVNGNNKIEPGTIVRLYLIGSEKKCPQYPREQCKYVFSYCCEDEIDPVAPPTCEPC